MDIDYESDPIALAGQQPEFFETPGLDRLYAMFVALGEELAVTNERHDTLQRILMEKGMLSAEDLDSYIPSDEVMRERLSQHQTMIKNILSTLDSELAALKTD